MYRRAFNFVAAALFVALMALAGVTAKCLFVPSWHEWQWGERRYLVMFHTTVLPGVLVEYSSGWPPETEIPFHAIFQGGVTRWSESTILTVHTARGTGTPHPPNEHLTIQFRRWSVTLPPFILVAALIPVCWLWATIRRRVLTRRLRKVRGFAPVVPAGQAADDD